MSRVITFKADETLIEKLDKIASSRRISRSELIRRAIREFVSREPVVTKRLRIYL